MNYTQRRKEIENEIATQQEQCQIQIFKDILRQEDIDLFY